MDSKSTFLNLNWKDLLNGLVVATFGAGFTALNAIIQSGALPTGEQLITVGLVALAAGLSYLSKNILTNSEGKLLTKEVAKSEPIPKA